MLFQPTPAIKDLAREAVKDKNILEKLIAGLEKLDCRGAFFPLILISEESPEALYPFWEEIAQKLKSTNADWNFQAIYLLTNMAKVDKKKKFEKIFDLYFDLLKSEKTMVPINLGATAWKIVLAKPELEPKITERLLGIEKINYRHQKLIYSGAVESFLHYFPRAKEKEKIIAFVKRQADSPSPKTKKLAKEFLKTYGK